MTDEEMMEMTTNIAATLLDMIEMSEKSDTVSSILEETVEAVAKAAELKRVLTECTC